MAKICPLADILLLPPEKWQLLDRVGVQDLSNSTNVLRSYTSGIQLHNTSLLYIACTLRPKPSLYPNTHGGCTWLHSSNIVGYRYCLCVLTGQQRWWTELVSVVSDVLSFLLCAGHHRPVGTVPLAHSEAVVSSGSRKRRKSGVSPMVWQSSCNCQGSSVTAVKFVQEHMVATSGAGDRWVGLMYTPNTSHKYTMNVFAYVNVLFNLTHSLNAVGTAFLSNS